MLTRALLGLLVLVAAVTAHSVLNVCQLGPIQEGKTNECDGLKLRYTFNSELGVCQTYEYGGCHGTANLFPTREACEQTCRTATRARVARAIQIKPKACNQPKKEGMCGAHIQRYYYHKKSNKCRRFVFGGCGGNENNFRTVNDCRYMCGAAAGD